MRTGLGQPLVSVLVVNHNGRHHLAECLQALRRQTLPAHLWEVVLVDNASRDGSVEFVAKHFPQVRVVQLRRNVGFAAGNNAGLRHARGEYIALLNNDTAADPDWLRAMVAALDSRPAAGGVACKVRFHHDPARLNSAGLVLYRDGRGGDRGFREIDVGQFDVAAEVFGPCGAGMMVRRAMLADVGFFDERLFMYYEDLDLAWRARARGWTFIYEPRATLRHVHCASSGEWSPFFCFHVERNRAVVNLKNAPLILALLVVIGFLARVGRAWYYVLRDNNRGRIRAAHAWAYVRAAVSLVLLLPHALSERYRIRATRGGARDRAVARLMLARPRRAA